MIAQLAAHPAILITISASKFVMSMNVTMIILIVKFRHLIVQQENILLELAVKNALLLA
jgi:hypothetical protein